MLQIFAIIDDTSVMNFRKNCNITFRKWGGGSKAVWNFSENSSVLEEVGIPYQQDLINPWDSIHQWRCMYNYNGVYNIDSSEQISLPDSENMMGHHYNGRTLAVEGHRPGEWGCSTTQPPPKWDGKSQTLKLHAPPPLERWPHLHGGWVVEQGCFLVGNN